MIASLSLPRPRRSAGRRSVCRRSVCRRSAPHVTRDLALVALFVAPWLATSPLTAQTDYYNTDAGRPIRIEDAYAIERRAVELQLAPLRLERARGGSYRWGIEPEIAIGLLPRTQVEIGFPLAHVEGSAMRRTSALAGIELSALYNLNAETRLPALAVVADVLLPAGGFGPDRPYPSIKAIATKTFPWARLHVNGQVTMGDTPSAANGAVTNNAPTAELSRWLAGIAIDRTFPLRSLLVTAELVTLKPLDPSDTQAWDVASGARYQLSPRLAVDAGGGYRISGSDAGWFLTTGAALSLGMPWSPRR